MTFALSAPRIPLNATAIALVGLAIAFNLPYAYLGAAFDYPNILRKPPAEILAAFTAGGPMLILAWYGFALAALAFIPVGLAHAMSKDRLRTAPALAISAAILGALAGLTQAMGLLRWVMVVPELAQSGDAQLLQAPLPPDLPALLGCCCNFHPHSPGSSAADDRPSIRGVGI